MIYLLIGAGGALGALLRFIMVGVIQSNSGALGGIFPQIGTVGVNIIGSFLIGVVAQCLNTFWIGNQELKFLLITGFLGGFTTFSSFSLETVNDLISGCYLRAGINIGVSIVLCIFATIIGMQIVSWFSKW